MRRVCIVQGGSCKTKEGRGERTSGEQNPLLQKKNLWGKERGFWNNPRSRTAEGLPHGDPQGKKTQKLNRTKKKKNLRRSQRGGGRGDNLLAVHSVIGRIKTTVKRRDPTEIKN